MDLAVVTGASSGIGEATVRRLVELGYTVIAGARRVERVKALAAEFAPGAVEAVHLDVTDEASVAALVAHVGDRPLHVLVNNAGLSRGLARLEDAPEEHWRTMFETNVMGLYRVTKALMPSIRRAFGVPRSTKRGDVEARGVRPGLPAGEAATPEGASAARAAHDGGMAGSGSKSEPPASIEGHAHIVNIGSIAGFDTYVGGSGYAASKHAVRAITHTLRLELHGDPVRITEINAGLVETEFSLVRFDGDAEKAAKPYAGIDPLVAYDIADLVHFAVSRPPHVNIDELVVRPVRQARVSLVARRG